jgi:MFS family permease
LVAIVSYGLSLVMLGQSQAVPLFVIAAFLGGLGHGAVFPVLSSSVVYRARASERGSAVSIFTSIFDVALLLSAPTVGSMIEGFSYTVAFTTVGVLLVMGGLIYSVWDKRMVASGAMAEHPA